MVPLEISESFGLVLGYMKKEQEYSGIWMKIGCFLSLLAILGIVVIVFLMIFNLWSGA